MAHLGSSPAKQDSPDAVSVLLASLERRISDLEETTHKNPLKRLTENAGACALVLGLILTLASLYDVFVTKPAAERVANLSQFNAAVNSAAKTRQELIVAQGQTQDRQLQLQMAMLATPRILNDIITASAIMQGLADKDIGIPQLTILISEAFTSDDMVNAAKFIDRAVKIQDGPPYFRSEAKRHEGRYLFRTGNMNEAREAYRQALKLLGADPWTAAARAFAQAELVVLEFTVGDCGRLPAEIRDLMELLRIPEVSVAAREQILAGTRHQMRQIPNGHCPVPTEFQM